MNEKTPKALWCISLILCPLTGLCNVILSLSGVALPLWVKLLLSAVSLFAVATLFVTTARLHNAKKKGLKI